MGGGSGDVRVWFVYPPTAAVIADIAAVRFVAVLFDIP